MSFIFSKNEAITTEQLFTRKFIFIMQISKWMISMVMVGGSKMGDYRKIERGIDGFFFFSMDLKS